MKRADPNRSSTRPVGYAALLPRFGVPDLGLAHASCVSAAGGMAEPLLFAELPDEELARMESAVCDAFALDDSTTG